MTPQEMYEANKVMSCSEIADKIGVTKNSVVGKIYRYRVANNLDPAKPQSKVSKLISRSMKRVKPKKEIAPLSYEISEPKRLGLLNQNECRYPLGEKPYMYCASETQDKSSYCPEHHKVCYRGKFGKLTRRMKNALRNKGMDV